MTTEQLFLMTHAYLGLLAAVIYFTGATARRIAGALAGGAAAGAFLPAVIVLAEALGWWRVPMSWTPGFLLLFYVSCVVARAPIYLITWRVARRFGWRGLAAFLGGAALVGPLRDYAVAAIVPEWIVFAPGLAPVVAVAATHVGFIALGHAVMRLVAGPARQDSLASWFWTGEGVGNQESVREQGITN
jgi:hypothetical protein